MSTYLTPVTLGERWDRDPEWVRRAANAGRIPGIKIEGLWRFRPDDIEAYEDRHKTADPLTLSPLAAARRRNR